MEITSRSNPLIVERAKLRDKKYRDEAHMFSFEGIKLFRESLRSGVPLREIFVTEKNAAELSPELDTSGADVYTVSESVYDKLSCDKSPDGILCTADILDALHGGAPLFKGNVMILCDIQDAGNLGTCLRSALAFGTDELVLAGDCADIYNRRCIRAAMGSAFRQRTSRISDPIQALELARSSGRRIVAAALRPDSLPLDRLAPDPADIFAVGNEGHGLPKDFIDKCDACMIIPMPGGTESLNAAVASSILMWESAKRRGIPHS